MPVIYMYVLQVRTLVNKLCLTQCCIAKVT